MKSGSTANGTTPSSKLIHEVHGVLAGTRERERPVQSRRAAGSPRGEREKSVGDLVGSLDANEFTVYDNGIPQEIAVFERYTTQPLSVAILIDTSGSTAKDLRYETVSIGKFLSALFGEGNDRDMAALYSFNYDVTLLHAFTRRQKQLEDRLRMLKAEGGTSAYDAIYFASQGLRGRPGRHVIVIVTDGGDTASSKKYKQALDAVQRAEAIMFPIVVVPITNDAGRNTGGEHALQTLAENTGGRWFDPDAGKRWTRPSRISCGTCARNICSGIILAARPRMLADFIQLE